MCFFAMHIKKSANISIQKERNISFPTTNQWHFCSSAEDKKLILSDFTWVIIQS